MKRGTVMEYVGKTANEELCDMVSPFYTAFFDKPEPPAVRRRDYPPSTKSGRPRIKDTGSMIDALAIEWSGHILWRCGSYRKLVYGKSVWIEHNPSRDHISSGMGNRVRRRLGWTCRRLDDYDRRTFEFVWYDPSGARGTPPWEKW